MDGIDMLSMIKDESIALTFFDPQYRMILDKQDYGNEGKGKEKRRCLLEQMDEQVIKEFLKEIERVLIPKGHLMLWVDKYILCSELRSLVNEIDLAIVDMVTWDKMKIGMGYRTRRRSEYLVILQKPPVRAKGVWFLHDIPDVWQEKIVAKEHPHVKPIGLQEKLIKSVTNEEDIVVDPSAGSFSVLQSCKNSKRNFLGCDILA